MEIRGASDAAARDGAGCLAIGWFDGTLLAAALVLLVPAMLASPLGCPSGGPNCGPARAMALVLGTTAAVAAAFTVPVLLLAWASRRWRAAGILLGLIGVALLAVPAVALARAIVVGDTWLLFLVTAVWLIVPGVSLIGDARASVRFRRA